MPHWTSREGAGILTTISEGHAMHVRTLLLRLAVLLAGLLLPLVALGQEAKVKLDVVGFTADQAQMLVKIDDVNNGLSLRLYDVGDPSVPAKKSQLLPFTRANAPQVLKEAKKKYKIKDDGLKALHFPMDPKDPEAQLSFFGVLRGKEGERLVVACTDGARMGKVTDVKVRQDEESKARYDASLKTIYWSGDKKTMVAVITQAIDTGGFTEEKDELHALKFKPDAVQWVEQEKPPEEKKDEKKEEKKEDKKHWWWPFG
jgi:hypothetical protein